jgi:hypothetical protein
MLHCGSRMTKHTRRAAVQPRQVASSTLPLRPHHDMTQGSNYLALPIILRPTVLLARGAGKSPVHLQRRAVDAHSDTHAEKFSWRLFLMGCTWEAAGVRVCFVQKFEAA